MIFKFFQFILWLFFKFVIFLFPGVKYEGQENIVLPDKEGVIFISNHQGYFDPFLISSGLKLRHFRSNKCLRYMTHYKFIMRRWYGFFIWLFGAYPLYPKLKSLKASLVQTIKIMKNNQNILMFPAGKIHENFSASEARPGVAHIVKKLNPLIVPVYISGTYKLGFWEYIMRKRKIVIKYGKSFHYKEKTKERDDLRKMASDIVQTVWDLK